MEQNNQPELDQEEPVEESVEEVVDLNQHLTNLQEELEKVEYKDDPYVRLLKQHVLPYSEIVYLYLLRNRIPLSPAIYQESHQKVVMLMLLFKHFPTFAPYLGETYTARLQQYLNAIADEAPDKPKLIALLFEDLIAFM
jgi:hypothetical protein